MNNWSRITAIGTGLCIIGWASTLALSAQDLDEARQPLANPSPDDTASDYDPEADEALFLLVSINGREIGLVAEFAQSLQSQRISALRDELEGIGIAAPRTLGGAVFLDEIPGISFVYDAPAQAIHITAQGSALIPVEISAVPQHDLPQTQTGFGLVLNYRARANLGDDIFGDGFRPEEAFAALDLRAYTPLGVLTSTGTLNSRFNDFGSSDFKRHDTYFTVSSPGKMLTLTAGDFTTSGPSWVRPVRLGGFQARRDFSLRDDLVTSPLLSFSGSAAVPSSIDVYVDNVRAYSGAVGPGPFNLSDVPMITSGGEAIFVLRDAGGNEQTTTVPFFATQNLLAKGLLNFSIEAGRAREDYGGGHLSYGQDTAAAISMRYGLSSSLTLEGHAEVLNDLRMFGIGVNSVLFNLAEITLAGGRSVYGSASGGFVFGALRTDVGGVGVRISSRRAFGEYHDLASVTSLEGPGRGAQIYGISSFSAVTALDAMSLTFPVFADSGRFGLSLVNSERDDQANTILSASYSRQLPWQSASYRVNAFNDLAGDGGYGVSVGFSMPLGKSSHASVGLQRDRYGRIDALSSLSRSADRTAGSYGYRVNLSRENLALGATYQTSYGRADLALRDSGDGGSASATFEGALVLAGGGLFAGNRIQDGFAVVDVGIPNIDVSLNNRQVARTGPFGRALVSDLRSYRLNRISIEPLDLPMDVNIEATAMNVVPARRSGVSLDFGGQSSAAALVVLRDADGAFLPPGSQVLLQGSLTDFSVGYDGEVWVTGLDARNRITVQTASGDCSAEFAYMKRSNEQVYIDGVQCR